MMVRGGKKSGASIFSNPWYFFARSPSYLPYAALAGRDQGGLFPEPTLMPPRKTGMKLEAVSTGQYGRLKPTYFTVISWLASVSRFLRRYVMHM